MTEREMFLALREMYPAQEYALLPQVANGTGSKATRHADAIGMSLWPSRGLHLIGFEMKAYRGDWIRELRNPAKAEPIAQFCNQWYIVASGPFINKDELPENWGLIEWDEAKGKMSNRKYAKMRDTIAPDLSFIAAVLRSAQSCLGPEAEIIAAKEEAYRNGKEAGELSSQGIRRELGELRKKVIEFEKASGITIAKAWESGEQIGGAVRMVMEGTVFRERNNLRRIALKLIEELGTQEDPE